MSPGRSGGPGRRIEVLNRRNQLFLAGKSRRLTFIEVPNDLGSMIDTAKVADLVLLMIDGSFGFEMVGQGLLRRLQRVASSQLTITALAGNF